jgi:N-acetylglucosaminyldiphosphoundecaprenol N-acetyl-beta-D-mannosaminyltransferase
MSKRNILGVLVDAVDYGQAVERVAAAAHHAHPYAVSALAVHGVMTGARDSVHRRRLNRFDLVTPDGQPVKWAMNVLHGTRLRNTVRGTDLTLRLLERAETDALPIFLYGSRPETLERLAANLRQRFPGLVIAGQQASGFREVSRPEAVEIATQIRNSGARIVLVGLGCPRQEIFVYELRDAVGVPMLAVGAAFDYLAGHLAEPPSWVTRIGFEWLWRLGVEPRRLWRRYLLLNPAYLALVLAQRLGLWRPSADGHLLPNVDAPKEVISV